MSHGHAHHPHHPPQHAVAVAIPLPPVLGQTCWSSTSSTRRSASSTSAGRSRCSAASWPRSCTSRPTPQGQSKWQNLDFADWTELSQLKAEFEPDELRLDPHRAVPDRRAADHPAARLRQAPAAGREVQPPQHLRPRRQQLPVLRQEDADDRAVARPRASPRARAARARGRTSSAAA